MISILTDDDLECILFHMDIEDIFNFGIVCKHLNSYYKSDRTLSILSFTLGVNNLTLEQLLRRHHRNFVITHLDMLGSGYCVDTGFYFYNHSCELRRNYDCDTKYITDLCMNFALNNEGQVYLSDANGVQITNILNVKDNDTIKIIFNKSCLETLSNRCVKYKTVIIKYQDTDYWESIAGPDYKPTTEWFNDIKFNKWHRDWLPIMNTRPWITINEPFMQITLSSEIKGSLLTLNDILFASRGLSHIKYGTVVNNNGYTILNDDEHTLIIQPDIDHFA